MKSAFKVKWVMLAVALIGVLSACGVLVDNTPPSVSLTLSNAGDDVVALARASDDQSGIKYMSVHARVNDSLVLLAERDYSSGGAGHVAPDVDLEDPGNDESGTELMSLNAAEAEAGSLRRSETLEVPLALGEHTLVVTAVNGSNLRSEIEQVVGEPLERVALSVQVRPPLPRMTGDVVLRDEFRLPFVAEGADLVQAELRLSVNGDSAARVAVVDVDADGGAGEFLVDGTQFLVGDKLAFTVRVVDSLDGEASDAFPVLTVVEASPDEEAPSELSVELFSPPARVTHGDVATVRYGVRGGAALEFVEFSIGVNGGSPVGYGFGELGVTPLTGSFELDSGDFTVGDSLRVSVVAADVAGQRAEQTVTVEVLAPEGQVVAPLEVGVTRATHVEDGVLFSDVGEFELRYYARSGAVISVIDLMVLDPGASDYRVLDTAAVHTEMTTGVFIVDASSHKPGQEFSYRLRAVDAEGRTEHSEALGVEVVERSTPVQEAPEVTLVGVTPSEDGSVQRELWNLRYIGSSGAPVDRVDLQVSVNGEPFTLLERQVALQEAFSVDGAPFRVGDDLEFKVSVRDELGRTAVSNVIAVTVVAEPTPVYDPLEVSAWLSAPTPNADSGLVPFGSVTVSFVGAGGAELQRAELWLARNGAAEQRVLLHELGGISVNDSFTFSGGIEPGDDLEFRVALRDAAGRLEWSDVVSVGVEPIAPDPVDTVNPVVQTLVVRVEDDPSGTLIDRTGVDVDFVVTDEVGVDEVRLFEIRNGGAPVLMAQGTMDFDGVRRAEGVFSVDTNHFSPGDTVQFRVEGVDSSGNTHFIESRVFEVAEFVSTPPFLMNTLPAEVEPGQVVNILVYQDEDATDGLVSSVRLFINGDEVTMTAVGPNWHHTWDTTGEPEGYHVVAVLVKYNSGTPILLIHDLVVEEPDEDEMVGP